jgi:uncharacterized protein (DUF3084 family)
MMWSGNQIQDRSTAEAKRVITQELAHTRAKIGVVRQQRDTHYANWRSASEELETLCEKARELQDGLTKLA